MKQLVTIGADGSITGLDFKSKGVDLRQLGRAEIQRISEVVWNTERQKWTLVFLMGEWAGETATMKQVEDAGVPPHRWMDIPTATVDPACPATDSANHLLVFDSYEEGVNWEVEIIQTARSNGRAHLTG